jgi:hypothetical protein
MLILQSLKGSEVLELAEDSVKVRGKVNPVKWPIEGPPIGIPVSSNLHADVPGTFTESSASSRTSLPFKDCNINIIF